MVRLIDRYFFREILPPFLIGLLVFTFILIVNPMLLVAEPMIARGVPAATIARLMATFLPQALAITIPMAVLVGLLLGLGRLSADRETVALHACGVSVYRLLRPVLLFAAVAWALTSYTIIIALPDANQASRQMTFKIVASRAETQVKPRVFYTDFPNVVIYTLEANPRQKGWSGVFVADTRRPQEPTIFLARSGHLQVDQARRTVELILEHGTQHKTSGAKPDSYDWMQFDQLVLRLDPNAFFAPVAALERGDRELGVSQLRAKVAALKAAGQPYHRPEIELQKKFSIPIACFVFGILGVGLGITTRKEGKLAGFVISIAIIFGYYVIMYTAEAAAKGYVIPPALSMWLPNIILGGAGIVLLFWRVKRIERRIDVSGFLEWLRARALPSAPAAGAAPASSSRPAGNRVVVVLRVPKLSFRLGNIIDRYVTVAYIKIFFVSLVGLLVIFYISTFIDISDKMFKGNIGLGTVIEYLESMTPQFIVYIVPMAALISTLVTIGLLTKNSEIDAIKACGVSLYRVAVPLVAFALVASGTLFILQEYILPSSNQRAAVLGDEIRGAPPKTTDVLNRQWLLGKSNLIYNYDFFDARKNTLTRLNIFQFNPQTFTIDRREYATRAGWNGAGQWELDSGWVREFTGRGIKNFKRFARGQTATLEPPSYFQAETPDAERMTYRELKRYITELRASGFDVVGYAVQLERKLSFPFVVVIMTLIAVPFAVTTGRRGALYGIGIGIVLAMLYWGATSVFGALGTAEVLPALLAAWAPNLLFAAGAAYLLLTVRT